MAEQHKKKKKHPFMVPLPAGMSDPTPTPTPKPGGSSGVQGAMASMMLQNLMSNPGTQHVAHHHFQHGQV